MLTQTQFRRQMIDTSLALIPLLVIAVFFYGARALVLAAIGVVTAAAADYLCTLFRGERRPQKYDYSAFIAGLTFVLLLPASAPYWLVIFGAIFAVAIVRHPFGGHYHTLFNPAVTAYAFCAICWPSLVTRYPAPFSPLPLTPTVEVNLYTSPAYRLMLGGAESVDLLDVLLGNFYGPMGTTCVAVLLCCGLYLIVRRTILWQIPVAAFSMIALFGYLTPRINAKYEISVLLELSSEAVIFLIFFAAAMDNGEIRTSLGKWLAGICLGITIVFFRHISKMEVVSPFAIIVFNTIDDQFDHYGRVLKRGTIFFFKDIVFKWLVRFFRWLGKLFGQGLAYTLRPAERFVNKPEEEEKKK